MVKEGTLLLFPFLFPGQFARHEGQFHKGFHPRVQHIVIRHAAGIEIVFRKGFRTGNGIHHGKVIEGPHVIVKDPMEANPLDSQGIVDELQLAGIIRPQGQQRVPGTHAKLPVLFVRLHRGVFLNDEFHFRTSFFYGFEPASMKTGWLSAKSIAQAFSAGQGRSAALGTCICSVSALSTLIVPEKRRAPGSPWGPEALLLVITS